MTTQPGGNVYTQGFGSRPENVEVPHIDNRAPSTTDILFPIGKKWINSTANSVYELTSFSSAGGTLTANWVTTGGGSQVLSSLTGDTGTAVPTNGNIKIAGTANQITTAASGSSVTFSIPTTLDAPGSVTAATTLTATAGDITATAGNVVINGAGNMLQIKSGAVTDFIGTGTLVSGTVTIANTNIATGDVILITRTAANASTTLGILTYTISAATSFTVTSLILGTPGSTQTGDLSSFAYVIVRPV